jgi:hypothetical protein
MAGSVDGQNVLGRVRGAFDLLPEFRDEVVDRARGRELLVTPDLVQDLLARDDLSRVLPEVAQQVELARGELDALPAASRLGFRFPSATGRDG